IRISVAHNGDQLVSEILQQLNQHFYLGTFSALADHDHYIVLLHHSEIAVNSVRCMKEDGRCAGGVESRDNLLCNYRTLANATDNNSSTAISDYPYRLFEVIVDEGLQP